MKTPEELSVLKEEVEALNKKLAELNEDELEQVAGGLIPPYPPSCCVENGGENIEWEQLIEG